MLKIPHSVIELKTPARVCFFGDHQDYLGLPVIAGAINRFISLKACKINGKFFKIHFLDIGKIHLIKFEDLVSPARQNDFLMTALQVFQREGFDINQGYEVFISGKIPINAGLSSSSSLVVVWLLFLIKAFGAHINITPEWVAQKAYQIEVLEHNGPGGLMDQYTISLGNLLFIDTVSGKFKQLNANLNALIIAESGVPKKTLNILKDLRIYALDAILAVKKQHPKFEMTKAKLSDYKDYKNHIPENLKIYFYAALQNYDITKKALRALESDVFDEKYVGELMTAHHKVLKDLLKITVPEIDLLIDTAIKNGAFGAKIVGSGGGGCIVVLVNPRGVYKMIQVLKEAGAKDAYQVNIVTKKGVFYE